MPVSPRSNGSDDNTNGSNDSNNLNGVSGPNSGLDGLTHGQRRTLRQRMRERYQRAREAAQLVGAIETIPEGAVRDERVATLRSTRDTQRYSQQEEQPLPHLINQAIKLGWAVPEHRKQDLVAELVRILDDPDQPAKVKVAAFNALRTADQTQFERDHPELAAKAKGGSGNISVQNNIQAAVVLREAIRRGEVAPGPAVPAPRRSHLVVPHPATPAETSESGHGLESHRID